MRVERNSDYLYKKCPFCGEEFKVEKGFSMNGAGMDMCLKCGMKKTLDTMKLTTEERKIIEGFVTAEINRNNLKII